MQDGSYDFEIGGAGYTLPNYWGSRIYNFALFCTKITEFPQKSPNIGGAAAPPITTALLFINLVLYF